MDPTPSLNTFSHRQSLDWEQVVGPQGDPCGGTQNIQGRQIRSYVIFAILSDTGTVANTDTWLSQSVIYSTNVFLSLSI